MNSYLVIRSRETGGRPGQSGGGGWSLLSWLIAWVQRAGGRAGDRRQRTQGLPSSLGSDIMTGVTLDNNLAYQCFNVLFL